MRSIISALCLVASVSACAWPNGTDTAYHWWQCSSGPIKYTNTTPWDVTGKHYEYPIHLGKPIMIKADMINPSYTFTAPNLRNTVNLWQWGQFGECRWSSLPTFGLLKDQDACANGVPCPIKPGNQELDVIVDFTKYEAIVKMLKNDQPYQLEYILTDRVTKITSCIMVQARSEIN